MEGFWDGERNLINGEGLLICNVVQFLICTEQFFMLKTPFFAFLQACLLAVDFLKFHFAPLVFFLTFAACKKTVAVAQLVRASDCDSEGRGFEPLQLPKIKAFHKKGFFVYQP